MKHTVTEIKLKNGARGLLVDVPGAPVFAMEFIFRAGDYYTESDQIIEVAHIMEHLALGANSKQKTTKESTEELQKNGAEFNAYTGYRDLGYTVNCPDFEWERVLNQMILQLSEPLMLEGEFKSEWGNVRDEMMMLFNNHWNTLAQKMSQALGFPKSQTYEERYKLMEAVTLQDLLNHRNRTHSTKNLQIFIAGDISGNGAKPKIITLLEKLTLPGDELLPEPEDIIPVAPKSAIIIPKEDVKNIYFSFDTYAWLNHEVTDQEAIALATLGHALFGSLASRIYGKARDLGLIYGMGAGRSRKKERINFDIYGQVTTEKADELFALLVSELKKVYDTGITEDELAKIKLEYLGGQRMGMQTTNAILNWHSAYYGYDEQLRNQEDIPKWINAVSTDQLNSMFKAIFNSDVFATGFLGAVDEKKCEQWRTDFQSISKK